MDLPERIQELLQGCKPQAITLATKAGRLFGMEFTEEQINQCYSSIALAVNAEEACPICERLGDCLLRTNGWVPIFDPEASRVYGYPYFKWRKCDRRKTFEAREQAEAYLGARFAERDFTTFEVNLHNQQAYEECREYASNLGRNTELGLLLYGPVGTGKTHLAAAILKAAFARGLPAAMIPVPKLLAEIRKGIQDGEGRALAEKVAARFFVVLDDLGAERTTDWVQEELFLLVNSRYEAKLPTVVTTNCTPEELVEKVGQRTADRLKEMCKPVFVGGPSKRAEKRREQERLLRELGTELSLSGVPEEWL